MSTAMIVDAPASRAPAIAASPTPPHPKTATRLAAPDRPGVDRRADAGHDAAAEQPGAVGGAAGSTFVHCPEWTSVFSANAPMPRAG